MAKAIPKPAAVLSGQGCPVRDRADPPGGYVFVPQWEMRGGEDSSPAALLGGLKWGEESTPEVQEEQRMAQNRLTP